ncbi:MAG: hypothetical protein WAL71_15370 [Terriglobales bacterium]|jgi:hypothetical protein
METVIYMPLLGEGTDCWRPVRGVQLAEDIFEVVDQIGESESWAFAPHSRVRCREHVFTDGRSGLVVYAYAVEGDPHYQLLKSHEREVFRVSFANGEEALIRVLHVDGQYEDFVYDLLSTNARDGHHRPRKDAAYVAQFANLVSARLEK